MIGDASCFNICNIDDAVNLVNEGEKDRYISASEAETEENVTEYALHQNVARKEFNLRKFNIIMLLVPQIGFKLYL